MIRRNITSRVSISPHSSALCSPPWQSLLFYFFLFVACIPSSERCLAAYFFLLFCADLLSIDKKGNSIGIGINLNFCFRPFPLYAAALRNLKHGCFTPPALINVIGVLFYLSVKRNEAFVIHAGAISFIASIRAEVKQIPYKSSPKVVPPVDLPKK